MLVSVPVVAYNSADYIVETLESIYHQNYKELELIISDDFSTDATIAIVQNWISLDRVKNRFSRIEILTVPKNKGVSASCNRCIQASQSDWVMLIAGDDILLPNCITDNMNYVAENKSANVVFSQVKLYQDTFEEKNYIKSLPSKFPEHFMGDSLNAADQYQMLLLSDRIQYSPSFFMNKKAVFKVGGYDESDRLIEDYPMWLKLTGSGERMYYFHKETVGYRMHSKATNNNGQNVLFKSSVINSYDVRKKYAYPHLPWLVVKTEQYIYMVSLFFRAIGITKKTKFNLFLYKLLTVHTNPFIYLNAIHKKIK